MSQMMFYFCPAFPSVGILFSKSTTFINNVFLYQELCILYTIFRFFSLNAHMVFEFKIKDIDGKGIYFTTCKSIQTELYPYVSSLCLRKGIIHSVLLDTGNV